MCTGVTENAQISVNSHMDLSVLKLESMPHVQATSMLTWKEKCDKNEGGGTVLLQCVLCMPTIHNFSIIFLYLLGKHCSIFAVCMHDTSHNYTMFADLKQALQYRKVS